MAPRRNAAIKKSNASQRVLRPVGSATSKQKHNGRGSQRAPRKDVRTFKSLEECREWQHQYWQGKSILELDGLGCGLHLLGSPLLPSQSPIDGRMRFEIMSGTNEAGSGGIRLCAPEDYWPSERSDVGQPIFLVPLGHIEQVIVIRNPSRSAPKVRAYQIIIVPTAATGSSPIIRSCPEIISFNWPDKKVDKNLEGSRGETANKDEDTYLSVLNKVLDEQLATFGKSVVNATYQNEANRPFHCSTTLCFMRKCEGEESNIQGTVYFLKTGLLFLSLAMTIYTPFESITDDIIVVVAKDMVLQREKDKPVSHEVYINTSDPYHNISDKKAKSGKQKGKQEDSTLLGFKRLPVGFLDMVKDYALEQKIKFKECEQIYYDFAKNQPMSGWTPVMPKKKT